MSYRKSRSGFTRRKTQLVSGGFTIVELLVVIVVAGVLSTVIYGFFSSSLRQYAGLQEDGTNFTELASQSHRIANVLRGTYDVVSASPNDLVVYAYFSPTDANVSLIHYYKNGAGTQLLADVTNMTANPPIGGTIPSTQKTYTVISNYHTSGSVNLFNYLTVGNVLLSTPIADLHTIKGIEINLAVPNSSKVTDQAVSIQVSLRNRKTNL